MADDKTVPEAEDSQQQARNAVLAAAGAEPSTEEVINMDAEERARLAQEAANRRRLESQCYQDEMGEPLDEDNKGNNPPEPQEPGSTTKEKPADTQSEETKIEEKKQENADSKYETKEVADGEGGNMSLIKHLEELRKRLIRSMWAIAFGMLVAYIYLDDIVAHFMAPAGNLNVIRPMEAFSTYVKIDIFAGFIIAMPVIFYQAWVFFLPALKRKEKMILLLLVPLSVILFLGGMAFAFILILPLAIKFLLGVGTDFTPMLSAAEYFEFVLKFLLPFGLVFELPLVMVVLAKLNLVTSKFLIDKFRYFVFISFVVSAIITPPDVISQVMLALPIIMLYGISIFIIKFILRK